ncbi:neuronal acetylcholine receptor subunit alpha-9-like [Solenopsis invicta]|uniref:neuronal acetylcholine receptor subunit alpha-9-like n=1 Tax=Solenopsis invicta TaxID=13686 RepID=UPI00193D2809|nr:neuronal acetylcholine receptor subunit alpha-9-like [Solenopsis invicta]
MRILNVFGFFGILCINQFYALRIIPEDLDIVVRKCKNLENLSPIMRLKKHLFCDYDFTICPNYPKMPNVSLYLMPKLIDFQEHNAKLLLLSWITLVWKDPRLTWTSSDYDEITFVQISNWPIWMPVLAINNYTDISSARYMLSMSTAKCVLFNSGQIFCSFAMKFVSKCNTDFTYWPYDKHECSITISSWAHRGEEVNWLIHGNGITMSEYKNDMIWDFKFINLIREVKKYKCCPKDTFPSITYNFLLTHHYYKAHLFIIIPVIALLLLTLTVLCPNLNLIERMTVASINFICHLHCIYSLNWSMPYSANVPNIMLFYRASLALATFATLLMALLRKLEDMSTDVPNWISFTITFVLINKAGRFLILNDKSKMANRITITEKSSDISNSERSKESSWKHFAAIIDWLSFFCVIITYAIILIVLVPAS